MLEIIKQRIINGTSMVNGSAVASMHAAISENGEVQISKTIAENQMYLNNKDCILQDVIEFESAVYEEADAFVQTPVEIAETEVTEQTE